MPYFRCPPLLNWPPSPEAGVPTCQCRVRSFVTTSQDVLASGHTRQRPCAFARMDLVGGAQCLTPDVQEPCSPETSLFPYDHLFDVVVLDQEARGAVVEVYQTSVRVLRRSAVNDAGLGRSVEDVEIVGRLLLASRRSAVDEQVAARASRRGKHVERLLTIEPLHIQGVEVGVVL